MESSKSRQSREPSPIRPQLRSNPSKPPSISRSRRSSQDLSPSRGTQTPTSNFPSVPSAAAIQRALSATRVPHIQPIGLDGSVENLRGDRSSNKSEDAPQWPTSPRLKSPPPSSRIAPSSVRKTEANLGQLNGGNAAIVSAPDLSKVSEHSESENDGTLQVSGPRPGRGVSAGSTLETVVEGSNPNTPVPGALSGSYGFRPLENGLPSHPEEKQIETSKPAGTREGGESDTESGSGKSRGSKIDDMKPNLTMTPAKPPSMPTRRSFTTLNPAKAKAGAEPSLRNMTVETETVSSIPQVSLGGGAGERGVSGRIEPTGSVRLKTSNETIRPKKEKKKTSRKTTSINAGTVSSKADIFEAKVASAVDEAQSSDSDETFVYESNPPEQHGSSHRRHHSRTPSATSMASQADAYPSRYKLGHKDGKSVSGKRSMKFTNSAYSNNLDGEVSASSAKGSARSATGTPRHHHIGRYGRGGHASLFDHDSPFTQASRQPSSPRNSVVNSSRLSSRPESPRLNGARNGTPSKGDIYHHDFDDDAADDERTPLVGSVRINRARHTRRPNSSSLRQIEYFEERDRSFVARFGACIIVTLLFLILIFGATAFIVALTKPLTDVTVKHIQNVLAAEQEILLDLDVRASNPNLFTITVSDLNVDIFAKSGYVRSSGSIHPTSGDGLHRRTLPKSRSNDTTVTLPSSTADGGVDEGTDPDPEADPRTMLLGRVYEFDSPLVFEASPFKRRSTSSVGQVRLQKPGNKTEAGGTERWERVLQHPFELTVRGNIRYQLPLSSHVESAQIQNSIKVSPDDDAGETPEHEGTISGRWKRAWRWL